MLYSYSFQNRKRDLSDILSTVVKDEPRFISNFKTVADATARKHEWLEDQLTGRSVTVAGQVSGMVCPASTADLAKIKVGTLAVKANDSALFRVVAVSGTNFTVELAAANGSKTASPASGDVLNIVSTPMAEGSNPGDGDETGVTGNANYNCTQIFRKDIILTGSTLAINVFGNADNQLNRQTAFALSELARDLNRVALFGVRAEASASVRGTAGGLYEFGTGTGSLSVDAAGDRLESCIINDAAQKIMGAGGEPTQILCSPGQARVLSGEYKSQLQILRSDDRRGAYVAMVVNEINGRGLTIMADPDVPDTDVWVLDPAGFGLSNLRGRAITDEDATPGGFDGIKRMALGELTFEFKNAHQRLCRISNVQTSVDALAEMRRNTAASAE
ncbi:MAG: DUF5309 family protein [Lentisphaeria bacterium]|nr:DUF5309 family protein [Lentisphaeria bacterium]